MIAGDTEILLSECFVVAEVRKALLLGAVTDALREDAGKKERVVSDVRADVKAGTIVSSAQGGEHFEKIIERGILARNAAAGAFEIGIFCEHFGGVVRHVAIIDAGLLEDVSGDDEEVKAIRHLEAATEFEQRMEKLFVIKDEIARFGISEEIDEECFIVARL